MMSGRYPFAVTSEEGMLESTLNTLGPITIEQVRDIGLDPMQFPGLLAGSVFNTGSWLDVQKILPQTPSLQFRSFLYQALEYSPRRRANAATLLKHRFLEVQGREP